jgi:hypothetical protein
LSKSLFNDRVFDPADGVKLKLGNKEKTNLNTTRRVKRADFGGVVRLSKADYLTMIEEKGLQNQNLGTPI